MRGHLLQRLSIGLAILLTPAAALAEPARIIIMRHAEKLNAYALCDLGAQRGQALVSQFLGRGAAQSLFATAEKPDAILAITLHTIETVTPVAQSWNLPVIGYSVMPKEEKTAKDLDINRRTQEAAHDVLTDPRYAGKTVVMIWEHKHIAHPKLEKDFPGEQVTLRQLLRLDRVAGVPRDWPDSNYDFFWIVDYAPGKSIPTGFRMVRQAFTAPFDKLPANDWEELEPQHIQAGCKE